MSVPGVAQERAGLPGTATATHALPRAAPRPSRKPLQTPGGAGGAQKLGGGKPGAHPQTCGPCPAELRAATFFVSLPAG